MLSTMPDFQLTIAGVMRHGEAVHGLSEVVTMMGLDDNGRCQPAGRPSPRSRRNAARLANALRSLGVTGDERVATFMWNTRSTWRPTWRSLHGRRAPHAQPAALPEQLTYIANHAEDKVVLGDSSVMPLLAAVINDCKTVQHVIVVGDADASSWRAAVARSTATPSSSPPTPTTSTGPRSTSSPRRDVLHEWRLATPKGVAR